jgi:SAM-dependent methyltransferase
VAEITIHPSTTNIDLEQVLGYSLRKNRLDPKLLYVTPRQAELWREVSLKHSPIHTNPEFTRIYRESYARIAEENCPEKIHLVGLGPGTGQKENELASRLQEGGKGVRFSAIDVSRDLVVESSKRVGSTGASTDQHLVCDLVELGFIKGWLDTVDRDTPRLFTFFGVVPNLNPMLVVKLLHELLRPGDVLLASVHLAPIGDGLDESAAMKRIEPQYNNPETLAWLREAMTQWKLNDLMQEPQIRVGRQRSVPRIGAIAPWNSFETYLRYGGNRGVFADVAFVLFSSLRYTPALFEELLRHAGVQGEMLAITACREEAIWAVRSKQA